jgi:hypothetical protein
MNTFDCIPQFAKMLRNLDNWLEKATVHAKAKSFEPNVLVQMRLAPDMYPLVRQVQSACDNAKFCAAYLAGKEAPKHPDTEQTIPELRQRLQTCISYLETIKEGDLAGCDERRVAPPWLKGKWMRGDQYVVQTALPNFYFHLTTAYDILRHNGVDVGKMDFIGSMPLRD